MAHDEPPAYTPLFWFVVVMLFAFACACSAGSVPRPAGPLVCVTLDDARPLLAERYHVQTEEIAWTFFGRRIVSHQYQVRLLRRGRASVHWGRSVTIDSIPPFLACELQ